MFFPFQWNLQCNTACSNLCSGVTWEPCSWMKSSLGTRPQRHMPVSPVLRRLRERATLDFIASTRNSVSNKTKQILLILSHLDLGSSLWVVARVVQTAPFWRVWGSCLQSCGEGIGNLLGTAGPEALAMALEEALPLEGTEGEVG